MGNFAKEIASRLTAAAILPVYGLMSLYLSTYGTHLQQPVEALFKAVPIHYLALYVYLHRDSPRSEGNGSVEDNSTAHAREEQQFHNPISFLLQGRDYRAHFFRGLLLSSVGDVLLVYDSFFMVGVVVFGLAQCCYMLGLAMRYSRSSYAWLTFVIMAGLCLYTYYELNDPVLILLVFIYSFFVHLNVFLGIASFESTGTAASLASALGAFVFAVSDITIAYDRWVFSFPQSYFLVMFTYYLAQLLLTISIH